MSYKISDISEGCGVMVKESATKYRGPWFNSHLKLIA